MPAYCYRTDDGEVVELIMTVAEMGRRQRADDTIKLDDGRVATRDMAAEVGGQRMGDIWAKGLHSEALGCHPSQVEQMQKRADELGANVRYTKDGTCISYSRDGRKKVAEDRGMGDYSAYSNKDPVFRDQ
jgi:hypothetical protein